MHTYKLSNGVEIPSVGFGTFKNTGETVYESKKHSEWDTVTSILPLCITMRKKLDRPLKIAE